MKKFFALFATLALTVAAFAQTPEEIIQRMDEATTRFEADGFSADLDIKVFLFTVKSKMFTRGDKARIETGILSEKLIVWTDGKTEWTYDSTDKTVTIKDEDASGDSDADSADLLKDITAGYDVSLRKQTATQWHIRCKKSRSNTDPDDPKSMDLVIDKNTCLPVSLTASMKEGTIVLHDFQFGNVSEAQVTFRPEDYPDVKIVDERK